jgi:hypothetical protein
MDCRREGNCQISPSQGRYDRIANWVEYSFGTDSDYEWIDNSLSILHRISGSPCKKVRERVLLVLKGRLEGAYHSEDVWFNGWPDIEEGLWIIKEEK